MAQGDNLMSIDAYKCGILIRQASQYAWMISMPRTNKRIGLMIQYSLRYGLSYSTVELVERGSNGRTADRPDAKSTIQT